VQVGDTVYATYSCDGDLHCATTTTSPWDVTSLVSDVHGLSSSLAVGSDGTLHVLSYDLAYARFEYDRGPGCALAESQFWPNIATIDGPAIRPALAMDQNGGLHGVFPLAGPKLWYAVSTDSGDSFSVHGIEPTAGWAPIAADQSCGHVFHVGTDRKTLRYAHCCPP
jgi:hypothetical protein